MVAIWYNHHHSWRITLFSGNLSTRYFFYTIKNKSLSIFIDILLFIGMPFAIAYLYHVSKPATNNNHENQIIALLSFAVENCHYLTSSGPFWLRGYESTEIVSSRCNEVTSIFI